eukprot:9629878-Alexandrium_andersonii.AAC.1
MHATSGQPPGAATKHARTPLLGAAPQRTPKAWHLPSRGTNARRSAPGGWCDSRMPGRDMQKPC